MFRAISCSGGWAQKCTICRISRRLVILTVTDIESLSFWQPDLLFVWFGHVFASVGYTGMPANQADFLCLWQVTDGTGSD